MKPGWLVATTACDSKMPILSNATIHYRGRAPAIPSSKRITGREIVCLLHDLNRQDGLTIVMVTHNREIAAGTDRVVRLAAGRVEAPIASTFPLLAET